MSDVRIKKSVLQSIIRKHLSESSGKRPDPSRRLTIGPDSLTIPDELPLSPSDRMSTQLEIERPPVEDPEYVPANSKELGHAVQALAEMVSDEDVEEVYNSFKGIIEALNSDEEEGEFEDSEESEEEELQESLNRKYRLMMALLRENDGTPRQVKTPEQAAIDLALLKRAKDRRMAKEDEEEEAGQGRIGAADLDATIKAKALRMYPQAKDEGLALKLFKIFDRDEVPFDIERRFMAALGEDEILRNKAVEASKSNTLSDLRDLIKAVNKGIEGRKEGESKSRGVVSRTSRELTAGGRDRESAEERDPADYKKAAEIFAYKGTSGIRQAMNAIIAGRLPFYSIEKEVTEGADSLIKTAYKMATGTDINELLKEYDELKKIMKMTEEQVEIFKNAAVELYVFNVFKGLIYNAAYEELGSMKLDSRTVRDASMATVYPGDVGFSKGGPPMTDAEKRKLKSRSVSFRSTVEQIIEENESDDFNELVKMSTDIALEDVDAMEKGTYEGPALVSKKLRAPRRGD